MVWLNKSGYGGRDYSNKRNIEIDKRKGKLTDSQYKMLKSLHERREVYEPSQMDKDYIVQVYGNFDL